MNEKYHTLIDLAKGLKTDSNLGTNVLSDNKYTKMYLCKRNLTNEVLDYVVNTKPNIFIEAGLGTPVNNVMVFRLNYLSSNHIEMNCAYLLTNNSAFYNKKRQYIRNTNVMSLMQFIATFYSKLKFNLASTILVIKYLELLKENDSLLNIHDKALTLLIQFEQKYQKDRLIDFSLVKQLSNYESDIIKIISYLQISSKELFEMLFYFKLNETQGSIIDRKLSFVLVDHLEQYNLLEIAIILALGYYKKADLNLAGTRNLINTEIQAKVKLLRNQYVHQAFSLYHLSTQYDINECLIWFENCYQRQINKYPYFMHSSKSTVITVKDFKRHLKLENVSYNSAELANSKYLANYLNNTQNKLLLFLKKYSRPNVHYGIIVENNYQKEIMLNFLQKHFTNHEYKDISNNLSNTINFKKLNLSNKQLSLPDQANLEWYYRSRINQSIHYPKITVLSVNELYLQQHLFDHVALVFTECTNLTDDKQLIRDYQLSASLNLAKKTEYLLNFSPKIHKIAIGQQLDLFKDFNQSTNSNSKLTIKQPLRFVYKKIIDLLN